MEIKEAEIYINGIRISDSMAMTVRVALSNFRLDLLQNGLGEDEMGERIKEGYLKQLNLLDLIILKKKDEVLI